MKSKPVWIVAAVVVAVGAGTIMTQRHSSRPAGTQRQVQANAFETALPVTEDAALRAILGAGVPVQGLRVRTSGDIVVLRGTADPASAQRAAEVVRALGVKRVANLITPQRPSDDMAIRREAERQLAATPGLYGTKLMVSCKDGVIVVSGTVQHELQKDLTRDILKNLRGAREIRVQLSSV